jgi:hypothetical protein
MRHSREKLDDAHLAKVLTEDEARRIATSRLCGRRPLNIPSLEPSTSNMNESMGKLRVRNS